ncbi:hypothetical protein ACHAQJ_009887 [Trichoderma viride]
MASTPKKRRLESQGALFDPDATPRLGSHSLPSDSGSISASMSSSMSRASSPKKQMMSLRLDNSGIEYQPLNQQTVPKVARTLFSVMRGIGRSNDILPDALKPTITQKLTDQTMDLREWRYAFIPEGHTDNLPGRIPSFEEVQKILAKAIECEGFKHEEVSWNSQVHLRLLEGIFENLLGEQCDDFNAMSCTTARPHREFKPMSSIAKMIDICIYASLNQNQELKAAVTEFCKTAPTLTINHTDFEPIQLRPLLLSIETKKPGIEWEKAQLQIGVWHAAQWAFLRWAVSQKLLKQRLAQGINAPTDKGEEEFKAEKLMALSKLGFIPGIIIQGNQWHLVISTYHDGKTKLWSGLVFGKTESLLDIYSVIAGVRELTAWARDTYLPWFKENILMFE